MNKYVFFRNCTFVIGDSYFVLLSSAFVHCRHIENAICINVKGHLDLRNPSRSRWNTSQFKLPKDVIVLSHGSLTFIHLKTIIHIVA